MLHSFTRARHARHARRRTPPVMSYVIATLALVAIAVTAAWATTENQADIRPAAHQYRAAVAVPAVNKARLARTAHEAALRQAAAVLAAHAYTVRAGDSLSAVAARKCGQARDWTGIYAASRTRGWTARNANVLRTGQRLYLSCAYLPGQLRYAPAPPPVHAVAAVATARAGGRYHRGYHRGYRRASYSGSGSMQRCIISRESGGNPGIWNASGHWGLYQFSASTWAAHGGSAASFGHASVAEQNRVYYNTVAADGYSDWAPYDGC